MKKILTVFVAAFYWWDAMIYLHQQLKIISKFRMALKILCMQKEFWQMLILVIPTIHSHLMMWLQMTL